MWYFVHYKYHLDRLGIKFGILRVKSQRLTALIMARPTNEEVSIFKGHSSKDILK